MTKKELTKLLKENSEVREALLAAVGGAVRGYLSPPSKIAAECFIISRADLKASSFNF